MVGERAEFAFEPMIGKKHYLVLTPESIAWDSRTIRVDDVEHLAIHVLDVSHTGVNVSTGYYIWLATDSMCIDVTFGAGRISRKQVSKADAAFQALVAVIEGRIKPRLVRAAVDRVCNGEEAVVGGRQVIRLPAPAQNGGLVGRAVKSRLRGHECVRLTRDGMSVPGGFKSETQVRWESVEQVYLDRGKAVCETAGRTVTLLPTTEIDAVLLPSIIEELKERAHNRWAAEPAVATPTPVRRRRNPLRSNPRDGEG